MKKLSSTVSIALILAMAAGTMGCAQKIVFTPTTTATVTTESSEEETTTAKESESETTASETTTEASESSGSSEATESTKAPAETSSGTTTKSSDGTSQTTAENSGLATVSVYNAYKRSFKKDKKSYNTQYPKIMVANVNTSKVNKEIADKFKPIAKKNNSRVGYSYYVRKYLIFPPLPINSLRQLQDKRLLRLQRIKDQRQEAYTRPGPQVPRIEGSYFQFKG